MKISPTILILCLFFPLLIFQASKPLLDRTNRSFNFLSAEQSGKIILSANNFIVWDPWLNGLPYRRAITVNNTQNTNTLTDYQVLVTVDTASLISAGKMRSDCGDIRFTDSDGYTQLNHWLESGCNSSSTKIWVKVPSIPASSTKTIYMYYGNADVISASDFYATFLRAIDDFEDCDITDWNLLQGQQSCQGIAYNSNYAMALEHDGTNYGVSEKTFTSFSGKAMWMFWARNDKTTIRSNFHLMSGATYAFGVRFHEDGTFGYLDVNGWHYGIGSYSANTWYLFKVIFDTDTDTFSAYVNGTVIVEGAQFRNAVANVDNIRNMGGYNGAEGDGHIGDNFLIRKYDDPEPTTSVGAEDVLTTQAGSATNWQWKVPSHEKVRSGSATDWSWVTFVYSDFSHRKTIMIDNTGNSNTLTDYQVLVTVDTASLISAGKMRSDCGDIRFTDSDGYTQLNHWLESGCNSSSTKIWVKVPSIPASSTKTIYMYYGNPNVASASNGDDTFLLFDDFEDGTVGEPPAGWTITKDPGDEIVVQNDSVYQGSKSLRHYEAGGDTYGSTARKDFPNASSIAVHYAFRTDEGKRSSLGVVGDGTSVEILLCRDDVGDWRHYDPVGGWVTVTEFSGAVGGTWYKIIHYVLPSDVKYRKDGESTGSYGVGSYADLYRIYIHRNNNYGTGGYVWYDVIFVRKYNPPEPTTSVGAEEAIQKSITVPKGSATSWEWYP